MMTLRVRLLLLLLPTFVVLMVIGGFVDYRMAVATTRNAYDQALASEAIATAAYLRIEAGGLQFTQSGALALMRGSPSAEPLYLITGPQGQLVAGNAQLPAAAAVPERPSFRDVVYRGRPLRVVTLIAPTEAGAATVTVGETVQNRVRTQRVMLFGKLLVDFVELDLILLLVGIGVYYGLRPLRSLRDQVESRSPRELQQFDEAQVPGEVRPLIVALNRLLELLHDAAAAQHRFVADAAHQMRTPVAGVLAQLELLLQSPAAEAVKSELATVHRGIQHLAHSANQLLALARAEPLSATTADFQPLQLQSIVKEVVERNVDRAEKTGIDLGADARAASIAGNAWLLDDLLGNLVDNALKYSPPGSRVTVRSGLAEEGYPYLEVEDDGPGIPEAERRRVRERFYRRAGATGVGVGLGLAIVEEISRLHRATFTIHTGSNGRGTRMRVQFPVTAA